MKNIIFITNYFGNGGAATVMKIIAEEFLKKNYTITIISFSHDKNIYNIDSSIEYINLSSKYKNKLLKNIERIIKIRKILKKKKNSTIISFEYFVNMQVIIANFFLKNKLIISERNDPNNVGHNKKNIRNFLYQYTDYLVCQTPDAKKYFPQNIQKKTVVIPNPIKSDLPKAHNGIRQKKIVNFCRIEKQKNLFMLVDAFKMITDKFNDYKLYIYGDGSEKENLQKYISQKELNDKIIIQEFCQNIHHEIKDFMMFVSSSNYEGISNSMIESMAIGLPTICTDCPCGGASMMIKDHENGILTPVGDTEALFNAMNEVIENEKLFNKLSKNGQKIKERLDSKKICDEWKKLI